VLEDVRCQRRLYYHIKSRCQSSLLNFLINKGRAGNQKRHGVFIVLLLGIEKLNLLFIMFDCILAKMEAIHYGHIEITHYEVIAFLKDHIVAFKPIVGYIDILDGLF